MEPLIEQDKYQAYLSLIEREVEQYRSCVPNRVSLDDSEKLGRALAVIGDFGKREPGASTNYGNLGEWRRNGWTLTYNVDKPTTLVLARAKLVSAKRPLSPGKSCL